MRGFIQHLLIVGAAAAFIAAIPPVTPVSAASKGSESKGRYYFRSTCKSCHTKGAVGGEITPLNKTQAQWKSYFASSKHARGKEPLTKLMTAAVAMKYMDLRAPVVFDESDLVDMDPRFVNVIKAVGPNPMKGF